MISEQCPIEDTSTSVGAEEFYALVNAFVLVVVGLVFFLVRLSSQTQSETSRLSLAVQRLDDAFDGIARVFHPMTDHALLETAIYKFFDRHARPSLKNKNKKTNKWCDKGRSSATLFAQEMMLFLFTGGDPLQWNGSGSKKEKKTMVLAMLVGLSSFVRHCDKNCIQESGNKRADRNFVAHNGEFLKSLYGNNSGNSGPGYEATQATVNTLTGQFEVDCKNLKPANDVGVGVDQLKIELEKKFVGLFSSADWVELKAQLINICGP